MGVLVASGSSVGVWQGRWAHGTAWVKQEVWVLALHAGEQTLAARLGPREEEEGKAWCARPDDELEREPWGRA